MDISGDTEEEDGCRGQSAFQSTLWVRYRKLECDRLGFCYIVGKWPLVEFDLQAISLSFVLASLAFRRMTVRSGSETSHDTGSSSRGTSFVAGRARRA